MFSSTTADYLQQTGRVVSDDLILNKVNVMLITAYNEPMSLMSNPSAHAESLCSAATAMAPHWTLAMDAISTVVVYGDA